MPVVEREETAEASAGEFLELAQQVLADCLVAIPDEESARASCIAEIQRAIRKEPRLRAGVLPLLALYLYRDAVRKSRHQDPEATGGSLEESAAVAAARERGKMAADVGAVKAKAAWTWMHGHVLCTGVSLFGARLVDLRKQRAHHQANIAGNLKADRYYEKLERLYLERCPAANKTIGEVVKSDEAERLHRECLGKKVA